MARQETSEVLQGRRKKKTKTTVGHKRVQGAILAHRNTDGGQGREPKGKSEESGTDYP